MKKNASWKHGAVTTSASGANWATLTRTISLYILTNFFTVIYRILLLLYNTTSEHCTSVVVNLNRGQVQTKISVCWDRDKTQDLQKTVSIPVSRPGVEYYSTTLLCCGDDVMGQKKANNAHLRCLVTCAQEEQDAWDKS